MKKSLFALLMISSFALTSCKNEEPVQEEVSVETAVQQMTDALDTTAVVATDSAVAVPAK